MGKGFARWLFQKKVLDSPRILNVIGATLVLAIVLSGIGGLICLIGWKVIVVPLTLLALMIAVLAFVFIGVAVLLLLMAPLAFISMALGE